MEFQITVTDMRGAVGRAGASLNETDYTIIADVGHSVADLAAVLAIPPGVGYAPGGQYTGRAPELWLNGTRLDPACPLSASGIRAGSLVGLGGRVPGTRQCLWSALAEVHVVAGPDAGLIVPLGPGEHTIGRGAADVPLTDSDVSRQQAVVTVASVGPGLSLTVRDAGSRNGTGLDGEPVGPEPAPVAPGQLIAVGHNLITLAVPPAQTAVLQPGGSADPLGLRLSRPPRDPMNLPAPVVIDLAAAPPRGDGLPSWLTMMLGPAVSLAAGAAIVAVTGQWLFLLLGLGGVVVTLATQASSRRTASTRQRSARREFQGSAAAASARLAELLLAEQLRRRAAAPDPAHLLRIASGPGTRLWERLPADRDFLHLRVGWADLPAATVSLRDSSGAAPPVPVVRGVPTIVALPECGVLGIAGPEGSGRAALAWAVAQLAVLHSPRDLHLVVLTGAADAWRWTRWLPHLAPFAGCMAPAGVGADPASAAARAGELANLVAKRHAAAADPRRAAAAALVPAVVVVLDGSYELRQLPGMATVLTDGPAVGVYAVCRDEDWTQLPRECQAQVLIEDSAAGRASCHERGQQTAVTHLDRITETWASHVARALAPVRDVPGDQQSQLPDAVSLLDLWRLGSPDAGQLADRWHRRARTTQVPLGRTAAGAFVLDIARDGPHMLVAGTTGAGKSEFLRTFVASLALGNRPDALAFLLIDYKGGSAFADCRPLPHVAGYLTDLDEHLAKRALTALAAEVRYREELLGKAGCQDIEAYHAAGEPHGPLPRLVLVIDEFRFLVTQMPDFLDRLTDVTARGRSLGMHLVLATQRPAGVISEDIRTNMALRVCFRVEDAADSTAVIDQPAAAHLDRTLQGRGFARTGHGATTLFQGAYVHGLRVGQAHGHQPLQAVPGSFADLGHAAPGSAPDPDQAAGAPTDLSALVQAIRETRLPVPEHRLWLNPLPRVISLDDLPAAGRPGLPAIAYGVVDLPAEQTQRVAALDLADGRHLLVGGASQSGRTTLLRTIAASLGRYHVSDDVHLYVLDCDAGGLAPLTRLPHCGAVVHRSERERAGRLLDRLAAEVTRRQELLAGSGFSSVTEQRAADPAAGLPYMVLLLDRWEGFLSDLGEADNARLPTVMYRLLSEGASAGLRVVATGDKAALARLPGYFRDRLVLRLSDANDLIMAGVPKGAMPLNAPAGRGVTVPDGTEVQIAVIGADPAGNAQGAALDAIIRHAAATHGRPRIAPLRVDVLPTRVTWAQASTLPGWQAAAGPLNPMVAIGGDDLSGLSADLVGWPGFAIAGPPQSGRSTALMVMAQSLLTSGTAIAVFAPRDSPLRKLAGSPGVAAMATDLDPSKAELAEVLQTVSPLAVIVDDAETLQMSSVADLLSQIPGQGRGDGHALVIAGASSELARSQRGFAAAARQFRCGLLLSPEMAQLGMELFGARLPRSAVFDGPPGRGYLIRAGRPTLAQVPEPVI